MKGAEVVSRVLQLQALIERERHKEGQHRKLKEVYIKMLEQLLSKIHVDENNSEGLQTNDIGE